MLRSHPPITHIPGSPWCLSCWRRPAQWGALVCEGCAGAARARRLRRRRARVAWRWAGAGVLEGLVGVGAGGLALYALAAPQGALGPLIAAGMLLAALALSVTFAHGWLLGPVVRRWGRWAVVDGAELALHWLTVLLAVLALGYKPGMVAAAGALTGATAALLQSRMLVGQVAAPWRWAACSLLVCAAAAGAGLAVELAAPGHAAALIGGGAVARVLHGLLAGPILGLLLVPGRAGTSIRAG